MLKNRIYNVLIICIICFILLSECEGGKKKKKTKKIKKPPITILESNNRTHVNVETPELTCTSTIEVLKKNETEDIELGLSKFDIVSGFGDVLPEYWTDFAYPPVAAAQIKREQQYYAYLGENDSCEVDKCTVEKKQPLLYANDIHLTTLNHYLFEGKEDFEYVFLPLFTFVRNS